MGMNEILKSLANLINQIVSADADDPPTNSESMVERDTPVCFFDVHERGELLNASRLLTCGH